METHHCTNSKSHDRFHKKDDWCTIRCEKSDLNHFRSNIRQHYVKSDKKESTRPGKMSVNENKEMPQIEKSAFSESYIIKDAKNIIKDAKKKWLNEMWLRRVEHNQIK